MLTSVMLMVAIVVDGIYPHLAMQNDEGECEAGLGAYTSTECCYEIAQHKSARAYGTRPRRFVI